MNKTSRILVAIVILLVVSNAVTAAGWFSGIGWGGKIPGFAPGTLLGGPAQHPCAGYCAEQAAKKKNGGKKTVDPDEDDSPAPRGDKAVSPNEDDDDPDDDDSGDFVDSVQNAFSNLKSAVMMH